MRYSSSFQRDWEFYLRSREVFTFCGKPDSEILEKIKPDPNGSTAKECFLYLDGRGEVKPCSEPELLFQVLKTKAAVNWQVKQWAEMLLGGVLFPSELVECRDDYGLPKWVVEAVLNQSRKLGWPEPWIKYTKNLLTPE